jgi:2-oxoglutarate ferredoxin oxidoreductase subunit beta
MPEIAMAELGYKKHLKVELFPTIWCPGCGIGTIMMQLAMVLDEMGFDETNTVIVTGIGCTGRMGSYLKYESVYTLHGRTLPVAEAIKTFRPELNVIVVAGDGDTASIGGNHLIHTIRRNANVTVLCNNNEIYGLTGGQTGPTTPTGTKTLSSPIGNPSTPINLQGIVRSSPHALYAKTTVYHQQQMRNVIREAIEWEGFSFVDITSQCIENNGRRIGFASANEMLTFYRKTYKRASRSAQVLGEHEIGVLYPVGHPALNGETDGAAPAATPTTEADANGHAPIAAQPAGVAEAATPVPGRTAKPAVSDDEKARRRAESQKKLALMQRLDSAVKLRVAKGEISLADALREAGIEAAELETGGTSDAPVAAEPGGGATASTSAQPETAKPPATDDDKARRRAESQKKLALMQRLDPAVKLRVAKGELTLADALREAGIDPAELEA